MTKEEFEALLLKKGFENNRPNKNYFQKSLFDNKDENTELFLSFYERDIFGNAGIFCFFMEDEDGNVHFILKCKRIIYKNFTEQKLDEILSQCTKIKTALEMINQIAKGE